jgi:hypothetical protein
MTELRTFNIQAHVEGKSGLTQLRQLTAAVKDVDAATEALKQQLGEDTQVTVTNTKTKRELANEARKLLTEIQRTERNVDRLTESYRQQTAMLGMTANEAEQYRAVMALGSNATEAQRNAVRQSVIEYQNMRNATGNAQGSMRNFRGVMQNFGWQMQDTIVQLQMGTSAFTVLSQQGSQMAAAFGPGGALIGALIAVAGVIGGTLFKSIVNTKSATQQLTEALKIQNEVVSVSDKGVTELADSFNKLYIRDQALAKLKLAEGLINARNIIRTSGAEIENAYGNISVGLTKVAINMANPFGDTSKSTLNDFLDNIGIKADKIGSTSRNKISGFMDSLNALSSSTWKGSADDITSVINTLEQGTQTLVDAGASGSKFSAFLKGITENLKNLKNSRDAILLYEQLTKDPEKLDETAGAAAKANSDIQKLTDSLTKQAATLGLNETQLTEYNIINSKASDFDKARALAILEQVDAKRKQIEKEKEYAALQDKENNDFERLLNKGTNDTESEYTRRYNIIKAYSENVGADQAKVAKAYSDLEKWKTDELTKEYNKREAVRLRIQKAAAKTLGNETPLTLENDTYKQNKGLLTEQLAKATEADEIARINKVMEDEEARHTEAVKQLRLQQLQAGLTAISGAATMATSIVDMMTNGVEQIKNQTAEMNAFQKTMFLVTQTIAAAQAIINGIDIGMKLAAAFPLAAPEMIALGTGLGAAQAGVIMGTTFAGTFDNGGYIPAGATGIMSEYGTEIANGALVQGPAQITSREDTAALLAGSGGGGYNLTIENRIPSGNYSVVKDGDNSMKIIAEQVFNQNIDGGVANVLNSSNSKSAKSLRSNYQVRRNLGGN